uniref:Uncharacterized protein n=1 Tax=Tetranychus urticae TaxID=32264 RepID=T1KA35_TETUR
MYVKYNHISQSRIAVVTEISVLALAPGSKLTPYLLVPPCFNLENVERSIFQYTLLRKEDYATRKALEQISKRNAKTQDSITKKYLQLRRDLKARNKYKASSVEAEITNSDSRVILIATSNPEILARKLKAKIEIKSNNPLTLDSCMRSIRDLDVSTDIVKSNELYVLYFSTGPENKRQKYFITKIEDIWLYDCVEAKKLSRILVRGRPWPIKRSQPKEFWPHYLFDISKNKKHLEKKYMTANLKELCCTCENTSKEPAVIELNEKSPLSELPKDLSINVADPSTIGTSTFLDQVVGAFPDQQASLLLQSEKINETSLATEIVQTEAEQSASFSTHNATCIANSTALPDTTKARDDVFQSISPIVTSRLDSTPAPDASISFAPDPISSHDGDDEIRICFAEMASKPANFPKKDDIWQLLYNFGLEYLHSIKTRKGYSTYKKTNNYDYVPDISKLINCDNHKFSDETMISHDFQIITPEGYAWRSDELQKAVSPLIEITSPKMTTCKASVCKGKCDFATAKNDMSTRRKSHYVEHSKHCMCNKRTALENIAVRDRFKHLIAPAAYGAAVYHLEDTGHYYGIWLCKKLTKVNKDPRKSLKFRILDDIKTCYIDGCVCRNNFRTDDAKYLVGHILEKNYLLVCEGCHRGIADSTFFLENPTEALFH